MKVKENSEPFLSSSKQSEFEHGKLESLVPIYQLGTRFFEADSEEDLFERLLDFIEQEFETYTISIMILEEASGTLEIVASRGLNESQLNASNAKPGEGIAGWVFVNKRPLILNRDSQYPSELSTHLKRPEIVSSICFPLLNRDGVIGVINLSQTNEKVTYSSSEMELVSMLSQLTVMAIENVRLNRQRAESVRMETLLEQYVSTDVAHLLIEQKHDLRDIGNVQELTILFADLRNFTQLVQKLELQELRLFLNEFFTLITEEVHRSGGTLNKFMGDGVLIVFGAPVSHPFPGKAAVQTALNIGQRFREICKSYCSQNVFFEKIALGIGVAQGEVFIGNVGSNRRFDYTVVGTAVNTAQRLASYAMGKTILVTDGVGRKIESDFNIVNSERIALKGFREPMQVHEIEIERI